MSHTKYSSTVLVVHISQSHSQLVECNIRTIPPPAVSTDARTISHSPIVYWCTTIGSSIFGARARSIVIYHSQWFIFVVVAIESLLLSFYYTLSRSVKFSVYVHTRFLTPTSKEHQHTGRVVGNNDAPPNDKKNHAPPLLGRAVWKSG